MSLLIHRTTVCFIEMLEEIKKLGFKDLSVIAIRVASNSTQNLSGIFLKGLSKYISGWLKTEELSFLQLNGRGFPHSWMEGNFLTATLLTQYSTS